MAIKFLSGLNLSDVTAGSILKLDSNGNIVAAVDGTDYNTGSADSWSDVGVNIYRNSDVRIGTFQSGVAPSARLHVFDYQTTDPKLLIEDGNTGDASMQFKISTQQYTMGIDNSDSDKFIIANAGGFNLAANTHALEISTNGKITVPAHTSHGAIRLEMGGYNRLRFNGGIDLLGYVSDHLWVIGNSTTNTINLGSYWNWDTQVAISYTPGTVGAAGGQMILGQTEKNNANWTHGITAFYTNGAERVRINSSGNVGIGTTSPEEKLHVIGNVKQNDFIIGRGAQHIAATMPDYYKIAQVTIDGIYGTSHRIEGTVSYGGDNEKSTKIDFWVSFRSHGNLNVGTPFVRYGYRVENLNVASSNGFESGSVDTAFRVSKTSDTAGGSKVYEIQFSPNDANYINAQWEVKYSDYGNQGSYPTTVYSTLQSYGTDIADANILKSQDSTRVDNNTWITQLGVGSSNNTSYSFYNNNTSYFNGNVTVDANLSITGGGYITTDSSNPLTLRSDVITDQQSGDPVIRFMGSSTEIAKIDQEGNVHAGGFKVSGTTGFLKSDGSVDTSTYASSSHNHNSLYVAIAGGYYDSDFTWDGTHDFSNVIKVSGASATTTNTTALFYGTNGVVEKRSLGTAAFSATGDFATAAQGTKADTAHGWGNHASEGYLTSYSETSTLDAVADRGRTTNQQLISTNPSGFRVDSGSYARIELDSNNSWSYIRFQDNGVTTWDIATLNNGNLEWRPNGGNANRMLLSKSGELTINGHLNIASGDVFRMYRSGGSAHQRADARLAGSNQARIHWYGKNDAGATANFKHAWYDGANYINVTATNPGRVTFGGSAQEIYIGSNKVATETFAAGEAQAVQDNLDNLAGSLGSLALEDSVIISEVTGLQTALNGKLSTTGKAADSNLLDGLDSGSFLRSDTSDSFSGQLTNASINETPAYNRGAINLQPSVSGGSTGITFRSRVNSNSDAGYIWWYDDNDHYNELNSTENGVLLIAAQNDGGATSEDAIAIESSGDIYLNAGVASGAIGSGIFNTGRGNVYLGYAADRARVLTTDDSSSFATSSHTHTLTTGESGAITAGGNSGTIYSITSRDTRAVVDTPTSYNRGLYLDFKNSNVFPEISEGGYKGQMIWRSYGGSTDITGGLPLQIVYTQSEKIYYRLGNNATTWNSQFKTIATGDDIQELQTYVDDNFLSSVPSTFSATAITLSGIKLEESSERPGLLEVNRDGSKTWSGIMTKFSGTAEWALMGDENEFGLFDDQFNQWAWRYVENSDLVLYNGGVVKAATKSNGFQVKNVLEIGAYATTDQGVLKLAGSTADRESILKTTNGNLHIDSHAGYGVYLNWYGGNGGVFFGNGSGASGASVSSGGVYTATGGNSTEWNTAYSWGNHASAGYLTSYTETDTLASVTGRGASTTTSLSIRNLTSRTILPEADRTYDLGGEETRWRVVFCETLDSAGQHESNLQDEEQPISQYATGTVLSWKGGKNRPCTQYADHMRMGIAVEGQDSPLIQGAEPVLVTGVVEEGDYLVTSEKEGHAVAVPRNIVKEQMLFDCVIGKALESGDGDSHLIKTWINI